jgi:CheY-like chemotaxis protein
MSAGPNRILIVDDDEGARYVKSRLLQRHGYIVSEASLGRDAVVLAETEKPDLAARNPEPNSVIHDPIPDASEHGSYFGLSGK